MSVRFEWRGGQAADALRTAAARGLYQGAEHVLTESLKVVPIEESTLAGTGAADVDEGSLTASVSYGTPYAARQHEELTWRHDAGRTAKYLENPLHEQESAVHELIAKAIREAL